MAFSTWRIKLGLPTGVTAMPVTAMGFSRFWISTSIFPVFSLRFSRERAFRKHDSLVRVSSARQSKPSPFKAVRLLFFRRLINENRNWQSDVFLTVGFLCCDLKLFFSFGSRVFFLDFSLRCCVTVVFCRRSAFVR